MRVLNLVEPTTEQILAWGYDEDVCFIEQDEDLVLYGVEYVLPLVRLASDDSCLKATFALSILYQYSRELFVRRQRDEADRVREIIDSFPAKLPSEVHEWADYFRRVHDRLTNPAPLPDEDADDLAEDLLNAKFRFLQVSRTGRTINGMREFVGYYGSHQEYLGVDSDTGNWFFNFYRPLDEAYPRTS